MKFASGHVSLAAALFFPAAALTLSAATEGETADDLKSLAPLLEKYCVRCHGDEEVEAGVDLSGPISRLRLLSERETWLDVIDQIETEEMPPKAPLPSNAEIESILTQIDGAINRVDWTEFHDPGRIPLARLTRVEYRHAIRDIFEVDLDAGHFLGRDPEGNTGFANDRESLTFPLFAFDNFIREAERVVDAWLGFGKPPWQRNYDLVETWKSGSDRSVNLTEQGDAILLKERNAPFQLNLDVPYAGLYQIELEAATINGEPIAAMHLMMNGESAERVVVSGTKRKPYAIILNLAAGANVLSIGYDPDRAPLIQRTFPPRAVPTSLEDQVRRPKVPEYPLPDHLKDNEQAFKAWRKLNTTIQDLTLTRRLADLLVETGKTDYEEHHLTRNPSRQIQRFGPSKVPFNLSAGSVAVFSKIPQAQLEKKIREVTGYSHDEYTRSVKRYLAAWKAKHPERVRKTPGRIALTRATLSSHAIPEGGVSPAEWLASAAESPEAVESMLRKLGTRAYGRRMRDDEFAPLSEIYRRTREETGSQEDALRDALVGLLVSPQFLLAFTAPGELGDDFRLTQPGFAQRLARFLWMSVPDQKLRSLAFREKLNEPERLELTLDRMIEDPRFAETSREFVEQWLDLEDLDILEQGNAGLPTHRLVAMREEPSRLFHHVFVENRSLLDLIDPDYTFLNDSLALHYDLPLVSGQAMRKVDLPDKTRGGLLSMGSILTATSTPQRTSPVERGAFIVELILGENLPPPPPSVPELNTQEKARTIREELERHREDSACSGCHDKIDPYGFVLEHYDQFGAWRDRDRGKPINASTTLEDGTSVDGLIDFKTYLVTQRKTDFVRNLTEQMFEFAIGREVQYTDEAALQELVKALEENDYRARTLIRAIVDSDAFRLQRETAPSAESTAMTKRSGP